MTNRRTGNTKRFDWITLWIYLLLLTAGWLMIYAVEYREDSVQPLVNLSTSYGKQFIWIVISLCIVFATQVIHSSFWRTFAYAILIGALALLLLVLFFGQEIKGSQSWFTFGPVSLQPGEVAKFPAILALAAYLAYYRTDLRKNLHFFTALGIIALPVGMIMLQPDTGTALTYGALLIVLFRAGAHPIWYILFLGIGVLFITSILFSSYYVILVLLLGGGGLAILYYKDQLNWFLAYALFTTLILLVVALEMYTLAMVLAVLLCSVYVLKIFTTREQRLVFVFAPVLALSSAFSFSTTYVFDNVLLPHQRDRLNVWLQPELSDPRGALYNVFQSKLAIGSGGLTGKGYLDGTLTKLNYVPEQNTDFIFVTVAEEQGFIGASALIIIYSILMIRIFRMGERMRNDFDRAFAYGFGGFLFIHFAINIGMTMGLMPVVGIPLPYLSYGGSSLLVFSAMMGVLLRMDLERRNS
ncbi:MAG: rod shape-determining protein RodA [Saprospirales bacterium]|nr:MAG: rod shape-determining protein RodA [Saprospirales bacterium]